VGRSVKISLVIAGYIMAIIAGVVAGQLYNARVAALPYDTSGGMYAGGELLSSLAAFLVVSLAPTLMGLWFLRGRRRFWNIVAVASLAFAGTGLVAVLMPLVFRETRMHIALVLMELLGLAQLLGVPLFSMAFVLFALLAPTPDARRKLIFAVAIELVIGVCALAHWFVPSSPL